MKAKRLLCSILAFALVLSTMGFSVLAEDTDIIEVGTDKDYETWSAAIGAATDVDSDGAITYHVYGKVLMDSHNVEGAAATINIIGMTEDAELSVETANSTDNGVVYVSDNTIETVNFSNLKLSRPNGEYKVNEGHHNRFFTVWDSDGSTDLITYTNCVFPNGSGNNQYGKTTYTNCTFNNDVYYALWIYGSGNKGVVEVTGCTFDADRGVKIYSEDASATVSTTITDSTFAIDSKPAIVSSIAGELVVEDVDATECEYGLLASEPKDGRADLESAAITVDGEEPVFVAKVGNMVCTDMAYAEAESNESKPVEIPVAKIGTKYYTTVQAAINAATEGDTIKIASGRYDGFDILVDNVTITGMTDDAEIIINSIPGNAFIGVNAEGVLVEGLKFIIPEDCQRTGDYLDGFDAVIGYWSNNFNAGSNVTTGYDVKNCHFVNEHPGIGVAMFNFNSFEIVGNTFENFNVGIHTMSDGSAMGDVVISGNTFTSVNEPVNVYWGQTGNDDDSIAITGNNFVSAKDADEIKITVHDYASTVTGTSGINEIDISGNTYSAETEVVLVDAASDVSSSVENALENVENVVVDTKYAAVARIGADKYFTSIEAALGAANPGDAIDLLGNNVTIDKAYVLNNDITFKNGMLLFDNYNGLDPSVYDPAGPNYAVMTIGANVTFDNVILTGENAVAQQGIFVLGANGVMSLTNGSELNVTAPTADAVIYSEAECESKLVVSDSKINIDGNGNAVRGMLAVEIDADNAEITIENITDNAMRNVKGTIDNSTISIDGAEYGIKNDGACAALAVANSKITITNTANESDNAGIYLTGRDKLDDTNSTIDAKIYIDVVEGEDVVLVTLNFATNGGSAIDTIERNKGESVDLLDYKSNKSGYSFVGWYSDEALTQEVISVTLDSPTTVYAKWAEKVINVGGGSGVSRYTVTFNTNGGTSVDKISKLKNSTVDLSECITEREGYTFEGWYTDKELTEKVTSVKVTEDITLYAKWLEIETEPGTDEPGTTEGMNLFADVKTTDWFYENVKYVVENELMNGVDEDRFAPNDTLTRAMLVTVLYRLEGEPEVENVSFTDVDADAYYANAVSWAKQNGIVNGVTESEFAPNTDITREQIAAIMHRYAQFKGYDVSVGESTNILSYADAERVSEYAVSSMQYVVGSGLIKGKSATTLNPLDNATRAEIAAILQRFIEANNN